VLPFNIQQDVFGVVFQQASDGISWVPSSTVSCDRGKSAYLG
jgi:hypothetical protein